MILPTITLALALQGGAAEPTRIPTVTRLVQRFADLERRWLEGVQKKDAGASAPLADDFEMRTADDPARPVPAAEWATNAKAFTMRSFQIAEMAARDVGGPVIVSFRLTQQAETGGADVSGDVFVVDVWVQNEGVWRVVERYAAPQGGARAAGARVPASAVPSAEGPASFS